ncbi:uncharacterized protein LOC125853614 [Solanum stenotomum]|uniref:uncharacterized protein LOC125853614 n=1 Tax=Solanum stenotomum TaxID=172797 RepID=UPI0020D128D7|nr:uncharacterized protein LOC125853614 [Solanum stenotomum]
MASADQMEKMKLRQNYRNHWHTDLLRATETDPLFCCFSLWCAPCASYLLRKRALYDDMSRYTCCGGYMPCSGRCGESRCPEFCLCTEVFLCFGNSVASTRFMLQDEFNLQTTKCDNCIIGFMFCLQQLACICSIIACLTGSEEIQDASQLLNCLSDVVYCTVCSCMQTQHKVEMDKRDGKFGPRPMSVPPVQQMSRLDQPVPPAVGYPPMQQPHGYPPQPHGYPPPQQQPQGYPPSQQQPQEYPPSQQLPQDYPPPQQQPQGHPPQQQPQGHPPPQQPSQGHPSPQQPPQGYPPPQQPPQGYPPANYPPPGAGEPKSDHLQ